MRRKTENHPTRGARPSRRTALALLLALAGATSVFAQPRLLYVGVDVAGGNGDDWIEPGETVTLETSLYNAGTSSASSVSGVLTYLGAHPSVTVIVPAASWPNLSPLGPPTSTLSPHFEIQVGGDVPCGSELPFRLDVHAAGGLTAPFEFSLKAGRRLDHDMVHDAIRRFEEQQATFWGAAVFNRFGEAAAMGDINGDGFADLIVGSGGAQQISLIYGQDRQFIDVDMLAPLVGVSKFTGAQAFSLASGDINGDGYDDIIIGAANQLILARPNAGMVAIVYGRPTPWPNTFLGSTSPIPGVARFAGAESEDRFGFEVAAGDVNGDGYDDVVSGAWLADSVGNTRPDAGEISLIYGMPAPWNDSDMSSPPSGVVQFWGAGAGDQALPAAIGDINGDGYGDIVASAFTGDSVGNTRPDAGEAYLIYGRLAPWTDVDLAAPPAGIARIWGASVALDVMGLAACMATGDFDADGFDDVVLASAWGTAAGRPEANHLYVLHGQSAPFGDIDLQGGPPGIVQVLGPKANDGLSGTIAVGDLNGDGYDDLIASGRQVTMNPPGPGAAYVLRGGSRRWTDTDLSSRPSTVSVYRGVDRNDFMGSSLAAGDVDGDGYDDLLIGARDADSINDSRPDAGEAYLRYGEPTDTYYATPPAGALGKYLDIAGLQGATKLALACDNCFTQIPIGFTFPFYAEEFDQVHVSSNGFLTFSQPSAAFFLPESCMPNPGGANHLIAPFWDDLNPGASPAVGGVFAMVQGTAPYRRLVVEFKDVPHAASTGTGTFEVILFETTGQIHFRYKDMVFGSPAIDNGASAVVGIENRRGAHAVAYACNDPLLLAGTSLVRYVPTTPILEEHAEQTPALWTPTGHWHDSTGTCEPDQHTGQRSWYYGNAATCSYSNGFAGALRVPTVGDFPADARLTFWSRLGTQIGFDLPEVQLSTTGTGGAYTTVLSPMDNTMRWKYGGVTNLFSNATDTVDLMFNFSSDGSISSFGWMVDDVQLMGCNATGAPAVVLSSAYAPPQVCVGSTATADAIGSYCGDSSEPARYQWFQDGSMIPGADEETYTIPDTLAPGTYEYGVEITCAGGASAMSAPAPVTVVLPPDPVTPTLIVERLDTRPAPSLLFTWAESAGADEYVVLQDTIPNGSFTTVVGTAPAGSPSLRVPMPPDSILYFLVAGSNQGCGLGPLR